MLLITVYPFPPYYPPPFPSLPCHFLLDRNLSRFVVDWLLKNKTRKEVDILRFHGMDGGRWGGVEGFVFVFMAMDKVVGNLVEGKLAADGVKENV